SYDLNLSTQTIGDPLRCRVRVGIYVPDPVDTQYGSWLSWGPGKYYYDESGHFWVTSSAPTAYFKTTAPVGTETFSPTDTIHITWEVNGFTGNEGKVRIYFYNGQSWSIVAYNLDLANGSYDLDLSTQTIVDPLRCRVRAGIYVPDAEGSQYGLWLSWGPGEYYYDESGHFWVTSSAPTAYFKTTAP
ncbi:MAG: hypothetical protein ACP5QX_07710, partial [Caldisericaceae bacterium]